MAEFSFSISDHATYLAGYMDAVGRCLTDDQELVSMFSRILAGPETVEDIFGPVVAEQPITASWNSEFVPLLNDHFGIDGRSRVGFYLVDYIDWFQQFTDNVQCFKIVCQQRPPHTLFEAIYVLRWDTGEKVVLSFARLSKGNPE